MASVIDYKACPQCGGLFNTEFNYRTFEEWGFCTRCGAAYSHELKRDEQDRAIFDSEGKPIYISKELKGLGGLYTRNKEGFGCFQPFEEPVPKEEILNLISEIESRDDIDSSKSYITRWDEETQQIVAEYGELPESFEEAMKEGKDESTN